MEEVEFPEKYSSYECGDYYDYYDIEEWFKQCIADFPKYHYIGYGIGGEEEYGEHILPTEEVETWFEKWFSQFKIKGEENE